MKKFTEIFNDEHISLLSNQLLFSGLSDREIYLFILHSNPEYIHINKGESVMLAEKFGHMFGVIYQGQVDVYSVESNGGKNLLNVLSDGEYSSIIYAEFYYSNELVEFTASQDSDVLLMNPQSLFIGEESLALIQQKILVNLIVSFKQLFQRLSDHLTCLSQRTIRDKVLFIMGFFSRRYGSLDFTIPYSREELANYLAVDRSALSRTLGELKQQGILDFKRNHFVLIKPEFFRKKA